MNITKLYTKEQQVNVQKLRKENPNRDIPSDAEIYEFLLDYEFDDDWLKDLIIRVTDDLELEFELI